MNEKNMINLIDFKRKKKIDIYLSDKEDNEVSLKDTIEGISEWIDKNIKDKEVNVCQQQIYPLMGQSSLILLDSIVDTYTSSILLAQEKTRECIIRTMMVGFYLLKWIQKNELKIVKKETDLSDEQISSLQRINAVSSLSMYAALMGVNGVDVIKELYKTGHLKEEDLETLKIEVPEKDKKESS